MNPVKDLKYYTRIWKNLLLRGKLCSVIDHQPNKLRNVDFREKVEIQYREKELRMNKVNQAGFK